MISAEGLTKQYDSRRVIHDLSFAIEDREIVGFLGLNGAGKTTVLKMLAGLLSPSSGSVVIDGCDLLEDPLGLRWRIGFLPERPPLYDDMTVVDFLGFAAELKGKDRKAVESSLDITNLAEVKREPISTLSHGYRQRLGIAQAIVHQPALVVLDEPSNGLDPVQIKEMRELIARLSDKHTVLVSSHMLTEISHTCDRIMVLREGRMAFSGTEDELLVRMNAGAVAVRARIIGSDIEQLLSKLPFVALWNVIEAEEGGALVKVTLKDAHPEELAKAIVGAGLGLRTLEPIKSDLESLFIQLTGSEAA